MGEIGRRSIRGAQAHTVEDQAPPKFNCAQAFDRVEKAAASSSQPAASQKRPKRYL